MRTESNATKADSNDPSPARRASLSSTDERGAPLKRAATSRLNHHRETLTSPSVLRSLTGRRRRCGHRPDGVPRVRRHHQARRRQRRARLLRKCPLPPLALPPHARSPEADRRGIEIRGCHSAEIHLDTSASGRRASLLGASRFLFGFLVAAPSSARFSASGFFRRKREAKKTHLSRASHQNRSNDSPTRSPSPRVRPSSS